jgi:hypothetical protein
MQMRIRIECGLDSRSRAGVWPNDRAGVRPVRTIQGGKNEVRIRFGCGLDSGADIIISPVFDVRNGFFIGPPCQCPFSLQYRSIYRQMPCEPYERNFTGDDG